MHRVRGAKPFNCNDFSLDIFGGDLAGFHRFAVHMNRAGAALGDAATVFGASDAQFIAQNPQ
jgi:hypothetical protein